MSRRRYHSSSLSTDASFAQLIEDGNYLAALLFERGISHADDWGRISGDAREFRLEVLPACTESMARISEALDAISAVGLWTRYQVNGRWYIQYKQDAWWELQSYISQDKRTCDRSKFPPPPTTPRHAAPVTSIQGEGQRESALSSAEQRKTAQNRSSPSPSPSPSPSLSISCLPSPSTRVDADARVRARGESQVRGPFGLSPVARDEKRSESMKALLDDVQLIYPETVGKTRQEEQLLSLFAEFPSLDHCSIAQENRRYWLATREKVGNWAATHREACRRCLAENKVLHFTHSPKNSDAVKGTPAADGPPPATGHELYDHFRHACWERQRSGLARGDEEEFVIASARFIGEDGEKLTVAQSEEDGTPLLSRTVQAQTILSWFRTARPDVPSFRVQFLPSAERQEVS